MSDSNRTVPGLSEPTRAVASGGTPDPWGVLERLLATLAVSDSTAHAVRATVEATYDALGADTAYWYSRTAGKASEIRGADHFTFEQCGLMARKLLQSAGERDVVAWANPAAKDGPGAILLAKVASTQGCIVAVRVAPAQPFAPTDEKLVRLALKLLLSQRSQAQAGTKQLLLGLVHSLTTIIDAKDPYTAGHSERVARIAVLLGQRMGLSQAIQGDVFLAGLLHDVGKIGIRDDVLQKPGKLTTEEFEEIRQHPVIGDRIVASIKPFGRLRPAVRHHHERYDGTGYPDKLAGEAIPLLARVMAVADSCDAMMSPRRYRPGLSPIQIDAVMASERGKQFDANVVAAFMAVREKIYPPIYQKGIGESAFHAIDNIVDNLTESSMLKLPAMRSED